jgi:TonB family protein
VTVLAAPGISYGVPALVSLVLHGVMVALLLVNWSSRDDTTVIAKRVPRFIEARLVTAESLQPKKKKATPKPVKKAVAKPKPKPKPAAAPAKPKPKAEQPKPKPKPVEKPKPNQRELAAAAQQELALALSAEDVLIEEATDQELALSYVALIARTIEDNWSRPPSARNDMEAELILQLIPTGEVVSVTVARSSGQLAFDRSAVNAVQKAERFPELQQLPARVFEKNFRRLRLKFKPEDLRY